MTHAELYAITAQGPAVIMVARDDMLALLERVERAEAGLTAAVAEEREACTAIMHDRQRFYEVRNNYTREDGDLFFAAAYETAVQMIRARGTT